VNPTARRERTIIHFWKQVRFAGIDQCWPWTGTIRDPFGYGGFHMNGRMQASHRVSWQLAKGPIPDGLCVLHRCDNPPCVNPLHLFLGTKSDNSLDRHRKGRTSVGHTVPPERRQRGERNVNAMLTIADVKAVRFAHQHGWYLGVLAEMYGVNRSTIGRAVRGQTWAHI
jgi:hypothetical protein